MAIANASDRATEAGKHQAGHQPSQPASSVVTLEIARPAASQATQLGTRELPVAQLALIREYLRSGRPLVGIRTASHAFHTKGKHPEGHAEWIKFDPDVLGGNYTGHHGNAKKATVSRVKSASNHPILAGIGSTSFEVGGSLYKVSPLAKSCIPLLRGQIEGAPAECVAWTHMYKRTPVFYTSLGHSDDFKIESFRRLFLNAIKWGLAQEKK